MEKRIVIAYLRRSRPRKRENMIKYRVLASNFRDLALCFRVFASCFRVFVFVFFLLWSRRPKDETTKTQNTMRERKTTMRARESTMRDSDFKASFFRNLVVSRS
jgi:predicted membrane protein